MKLKAATDSVRERIDMKTGFFWITLIGLLTGCSKPDYALDGQVFIVTRGGQSVKLGLVNVRAIPHADLATWARAKILSGQGEVQFPELPHSAYKAVTDADGNFALRLPPATDGRHLVIAEASRNLGTKTENYYWYVWIDAAKKSSKVLLSNDNHVDNDRVNVFSLLTSSVDRQ